MKEIFDGVPKLLGMFDLPVEEYFSYTYLPIKLVGQSSVTVERRLQVFDPIIGRACCDFIGDFGLDLFIDSYVYLTAKHAKQRAGCGFNRPGWHSDGFMSDDISYVWSNRQPTVFNPGPFVLTLDDALSMVEMEQQADETKNVTHPNGTLVRMDQSVIHKVAEFEPGDRAFAKIVVSRDVFNLEGNSINYDLGYRWNYVERRAERNIPQAFCSRA